MINRDDRNPWKAQRINFLLIFAFILMITVCSTFTEPQDLSVSYNEADISFSYPGCGISDFRVPYERILTYKLEQNWDLGSVVEGISTDGIYFGTYENSTNGVYRLCAYTNCDTYIVLTTPDCVYVFNYPDAQTTEGVYDALPALLD